MSELPDLGRHRRPGSPPRPEVLEAIVATGRRRLRRAALGSAGALGTVVALVLGAGLLGTPGGDALVVVPASPAPVLTTLATPSAAVLLPEPSPGDQQPVASGVRPSPQPRPVDRPGVAAGPGGSIGEDEEPQPAPGPQRPLPEHREQPDRRYSSGDLCQGPTASWAPQGYRVCMDLQASTSVTQGKPVEVGLDLCSSLSSRGQLRLSFGSGREHEVQVRPQNAPDDLLWTWSRHHRFPQGPHQLLLGPGECLTWTTMWDTRDDEGRPLPPGTYVMEATVDAEGVTQWVQQVFQLNAA